ncbi:MAG: hypothetical protein QXS57_03120 [Candidatus Caldarchaeum sp.]|uniref:Uncharacterized protein n=1 Tax=Caldiarchaeum subterraneum TaxID=311458 RepID=A0A7J3VRN7_CALS0
MTEEEEVSAIVVAFDGDDCIVSPTSPLEPTLLQKLLGSKVLYEDFKGDLWEGVVTDVYGVDNLVVRFSEEAISQGGPSGLGQGSLVKIIPSRT